MQRLIIVKLFHVIFGAPIKFYSLTKTGSCENWILYKSFDQDLLRGKGKIFIGNNQNLCLQLRGTLRALSKIQVISIYFVS